MNLIAPTAPEEVEATVLSVGETDPDGIQALVNVFGSRPVNLASTDTEHAPDAILAEALLGYGAIAVGAPDAAERPWMLSPTVDGLLASTSIPLVIVRRERNLDGRLPAAFARAVVPVTAMASSRAAQEIAGNISAHIGTELILTRVVSPVDIGVGGKPPISLDDHESDVMVATAAPSATVPEDRVDMATRVMDQASAFADELGARYRRELRRGASTADEICAVAHDVEADLVVLGANLRRLDGRPYLGHLVERVLDRCECTVVVVATPSGLHG